MTGTWVVEFDCGEAIIREGNREEIGYPDSLGCLPTAIYAHDKVILKTMPWVKDGELRCEIHEKL
jgi:hypothetical protein